MKRYIVAAGVCLTAGIGLTVNIQHSNAGMNHMKVTLADVEALSNDESPTVSCRGLGSLDCPKTEIKVKEIISE